MKQARALRVGRLLFGCWASAMGVAALGQALQDPTRPPPGRMPPAAVAEQPGTTDVRKAHTPVGLTLILSGAHRQVALLDGQLMRLGIEVAGARLVAISATQAVLETDGRPEALSLYPRVLKLARPTAPHARTPPHGPPRPPLKHPVQP